MFCRLSGKLPTLEALFNITSALACILKQIFIFSVLILPLFLGRFVDRHFYLRLHSGSNFHVSALGYSNVICISYAFLKLRFQITAPDFVTALRKLRLLSFASRMHFAFTFHVLAVDFAIITENAPRFGAKHSTTPSRNECLMMIAYNNCRLSVACSSSHIGAQTLVSKIAGRRCALRRGPSIISWIFVEFPI